MALANKRAVARFRFPGRHEATFRHINNLFRPFCNVLKREQTEGCRLTGPMADDAVVEHDWGNVFVERDCFRPVVDVRLGWFVYRLRR